MMEKKPHAAEPDVDTIDTRRVVSEVYRRMETDKAPKRVMDGEFDDTAWFAAAKAAMCEIRARVRLEVATDAVAILFELRDCGTLAETKKGIDLALDRWQEMAR